MGVVVQVYIAAIINNTDGSMLQRRDKRKVFNLSSAVAYEM